MWATQGVVTYNPGNVVCICGPVAVLDWESLREAPAARQSLMQGVHGEIRRLYMRGADIARFQLEVPAGSIYNFGLSTVELTELPVPFAITSIDRDFLTTTAFLWPAIISSKAPAEFERVSNTRVWTIEGIRRLTL